MKRKSLSPKFLISNNVFDPTIKTSCVNTIMLCNNQICFTLNNSSFQYWTFDNKEIAATEYLRIKSELNKYIIS